MLFASIFEHTFWYKWYEILTTTREKKGNDNTKKDFYLIIFRKFGSFQASLPENYTTKVKKRTLYDENDINITWSK